MKNQYFGDENDYKKYGILRGLSNAFPDGIAICWMLTPNDERHTGEFRDYLNKPEKWRRHDIALYDALQGCQREKALRSLSLAKDALGIPPAVFYEPELKPDVGERESYFKDFMDKAGDCGLLFFDPDKGLAPKRMQKGLKESSGYLFWDELEGFYSRKLHSILIYQHFTRQSRLVFIAEKVARLLVDTGAPEVYSLRTNRMVYFLIAQPQHSAGIERACQTIAKQWTPHVEIWQHPQPRKVG